MERIGKIFGGLVSAAKNTFRPLDGFYGFEESAPDVPDYAEKYPADWSPEKMEEKESLLEQLREMWEDARLHREETDDDWEENLSYFKGDQWSDDTPDALETPVLNICFSNIQSALPVLTDQRPSIDIMPKDGADKEIFADVLNETKDYIFRCERMQEKDSLALTQAMIFGNSYYFVWWDASKNRQYGGDVIIRVIDPRDVFIDPDTLIGDIDSARFFFIRSYQSKADLVANYGEIAETIDEGIEGDSSIFTMLVDNRRTNTRKKPLVLECFWEDDSEDEEGNPLYPYGRISVICQDIILEDKPIILKYPGWTLVHLIDHISPDNVLGIGELTFIKDPQDVINKTLGMMLDYRNYSLNPSVIMDADCGIDPEMITNDPGEIYPIEPASRFEKVPAPPMPNYPFELIQLMMGMSQTVSGVQEVSQGKKPAGFDPSGKAVMLLQEAAQTRIREKSRHLESAHKKITEILIAFVTQFYETPRMIRITGEKAVKLQQAIEQKQQAYQMMMQQMAQQSGMLPEQMGLPAQMPLPMQLQQGQKAAYMTFLGTGLSGDYDVEVQPSSDMPFNKTVKATLGMELYKSNAIDQKALLDAITWLNADEIINRMSQAAQAQAQQSAQMEAMKIQQSAQVKMAMDAQRAEAEIKKEAVKGAIQAAQKPPAT